MNLAGFFCYAENGYVMIQRPATLLLLDRIPMESFDGNGTDQVRDWLVAYEESPALAQETIDRLMELTLQGNLRWVALPPSLAHM